MISNHIQLPAPKSFFTTKWWLPLIIYVVLDIIATGAGMGVPIFCIVLGFPVGWYLTRRYLMMQSELKVALKKALCGSLITSGITFIYMAILWGRAVPMLFNTEFDYANFGIPMVLFDPKASFVGWLALMIVISPSLQLLVTVFTAYLTLIRRLKQKTS